MKISKHKNNNVLMMLSNMRIIKLLNSKDGANLKLPQANRYFKLKLLLQFIHQLNALDFFDFQKHKANRISNIKGLNQEANAV